MRQVWITKAGEPEVLVARNAPDPEPGEGEVRIRVEAAGVNFADIMARLGVYRDAPDIRAFRIDRTADPDDAIDEEPVEITA